MRDRFWQQLKNRLHWRAILLWLGFCLAAVTWSQMSVTPLKPQSTPAKPEQILVSAADSLKQLIDSWQQAASDPAKLTELQAVKRFCLLDVMPLQPSQDQCLPITYLTLVKMRQATEAGRSDVVMMQPHTEQAYIQLIQKRQQTWLLLALKPSALDNFFAELSRTPGDWALYQGNNFNQPVRALGDAMADDKLNPLIVPIEGSHWHLRYRPSQDAGSVMPYVSGLFAVLMASLIWWLLTGKSTGPKNAAGDASQRSTTDGKVAKRPAAKAPITNDKEAVRDLTYQPAFWHQKMLEEPIKNNTPPPAQAAPDNVETETIYPEIFKTYDIRGIVGSQLSVSVMIRLGEAIGSEAQDRGQPKLILARDGRASSERFARAITKGLNAAGCDVLDIGALPTPLMYFASEHFATKSGVMITGSHNPANYNGVKIVLGGETLSGEAIQGLYHRLQQNQLTGGAGQRQIVEVLDDYIAAVTSQIKLKKSMHVVIDCGNGIAGLVAPTLIRAIGCQVTELFCDVDSRFPNHHPNPGQPENLQALIEAVQLHEADLGLAFDGDGDRLGVVTAEGQIIWPDRLLLLFAQAILQKSPGETILFDVKSSGLLFEEITKAGGLPVMTTSGHSLIKQKLQETGAKLAGELSGHIFFADRWYGFDDALYAACRLLELLAAESAMFNRSPSTVFAMQPKSITTPEIHVAMDEAECRELMQQLTQHAEFAAVRKTTIDGLRVDFTDGWGLVRASNTLPGLSLRFEATDTAALQRIQRLFKQQIQLVAPQQSLPF